MGKVRCPRPVYKDRLVIDFFVVDKQVNYIVYKWNDEGTVRSGIDKGKLGDQSPQQILQDALQNFSNVNS